MAKKSEEKFKIQSEGPLHTRLPNPAMTCQSAYIFE